jgi:hypothetical protein
MTIIARESWQTLEPLLDRALDLEPAERATWLDELSARSPVLAAELNAFLSAEALADRSGFLSGPAEVGLAGLQLGAYQLERPLGQGGMGTVWLARRTDGRFEGTAAVKLLHLALLSAKGQERFRLEGSVLARLTHPGIARLLDAGVSGAGQPYLILEHVDGQAIDRFASERGLSSAERIRLFLQVLAAVGHAHTNLIVHRDLKPSNILVRADGTVKLLDFGIAKLLEADPGAESATLTAEGSRVFTLNYAAPEQARGEALTTTTDVYALGVLLYVLLSGRHPTNEQARSPAECLSALFEVEPKALGLGDLDTVLAKALRKAPAERYQTVAAFGDDLERFLSRKPVRARPQSLTYRLGKFAHRNRLAVSATALAVVALLAATVFSVVQMREARRQRDVALRSAELAQAMSQLQAVLAGDSRGGDGRPLGTAERIALAERVLTREYQAQPWLVSELLSGLSGRYIEMGDRVAQRSMLARSLAVARTAGQPAQIALASCLRANSLAYDDLIDSARAALADAKAALAQPDVRATPDLQATCLDAEGQTLIAAGQSDSGIPLLARAVGLVQSDIHGLRFEMLNNLAAGLRLVGRTREAIPYQRRVLAELDSTGYGDTELVPNMASFLAGSLTELGELAAVDSGLRPLVREQEAIHGAGHVAPMLAFLYGQGKLQLGDLDSADLWLTRAVSDTVGVAVIFTGRVPDAMTLLRLEQGRLVEARRASAGLSGRARGRRASQTLLRARLLHAEGKPPAASALLEGELNALATDGHPLLNLFALPMVYAGEWRLAAGDPAGADSLARLAHKAAIRGDSLGAERSGYAGRADLLQARALRARGDRPGATAALERALVALANGYGSGNRWTLEARALRDSLQR